MQKPAALEPAAPPDAAPPSPPPNPPAANAAAKPPAPAAAAEEMGLAVLIVLSVIPPFAEARQLYRRIKENARAICCGLGGQRDGEILAVDGSVQIFCVLPGSVTEDMVKAAAEAHGVATSSLRVEIYVATDAYKRLLTYAAASRAIKIEAPQAAKPTSVTFRKRSTIEEALQVVLNSASHAWLVLCYSEEDPNNSITYQSHGIGPISDAVALLGDDKVQYCFFHIAAYDEEGGIKVFKARNVLVVWTGPNVRNFERARKAPHASTVSELLAPSHAQLQAEDKEYLTEENVLYHASAGAHVVNRASSPAVSRERPDPKRTQDLS